MAKGIRNEVFNMPESHIQSGDKVVVNMTSVPEPEFHLAKVVEIVDGGPELEVVVSVGRAKRMHKFAFTESPLGLVGFFRHDRKDQTGAWVGKEKAHLCIEEHDWVSMGAIDRYFGGSKEMLADQKVVRDWIFERAAERAAIDSGEKEPGKWDGLGRVPKDATSPKSAPDGFKEMLMEPEHLKMARALDVVEGVELLLEGIVYQSDVEDDFGFDVDVQGDVYHVTTQDKINCKWDVELKGDGEVAYGTEKDVLDWIKSELLHGDMKIDVEEMSKPDLIGLILRLRDKVDDLLDEVGSLERRDQLEKIERVDVPPDELAECEEKYRAETRARIERKDNVRDVYMELWYLYDEHAMQRFYDGCPRRAACLAKVLREFCEEHGFYVKDFWEERDWKEEQREQDEFLDRFADEDLGPALMRRRRYHRGDRRQHT